MFKRYPNFVNFILKITKVYVCFSKRMGLASLVLSLEKVS